MTPTAKIVFGAGANLAAWDFAARCIGAPPWVGLTVAGVSMALATARAPLPAPAAAVVRFANAPGNLAVSLLDATAPEQLSED